MLDRDIWRTISKRVTGEELIAQLRDVGSRLVARPGALVHRHSTRVIFSHGPALERAGAYALPPTAAALLTPGDAGPIDTFHVHLLPSRKAPAPTEAVGAWWLRLADVLEAAMAAGFHAEKSARNVVRVHRPAVPFMARTDVERAMRTRGDTDHARAVGAELARVYRLGARQLRGGRAHPEGATLRTDQVFAVAAYDEQDRFLCLVGRPALPALLPTARTRIMLLCDAGVTLQRSAGFEDRLPAAPAWFEPYRWTLP